MQTSSSTTTFHVCASAYLFTGKERDAESGLDYFGARYYASTMGRWMSPDWAAKAQPVPYAKLDNPQSLNLYGYVYNNPLSRFNPDGHETTHTTRAAKRLATPINMAFGGIRSTRIHSH
jgi:RHS repeat-associated protein